MAVETYFFRHKRNQGLYAYLELGETWEESFLMEFRITEDAPHFVKTGAIFDNRHLLLAFKYIATLNYVDAQRDKKLDWRKIEADTQLKYSAQTFIESFMKKE